MFNIQIDNKPIEVRRCRVSALPLNKLWDGVQRPVEQTEDAYYASFDMSEAVTLKIERKEPFETYDIRPHKKGIATVSDGNTLYITVKEACQFSVEFDGPHNALHIFANPPSIKPENVDLYYPAGVHDVGLIWLEDNQTIYLEEGAIVNGIIYGKDVDNVSITGRGILCSANYKRGNDDTPGGQEAKAELIKKGFTTDELKYVSSLVLNHCTNVTVEGIIIEDAPLWAVIVHSGSENITIDNIKLIGNWRYNSDGVDLCVGRNMTLKNSFIRSFDDCIVVRGAYLPGEEGDVEKVVIENNVCWCDWGISLEIWCGPRVTRIHDVLFKNNYLIHLSYKAMDIATWFGSQNSLVENIRYDGVYVDSDDEYKNLVVESADNLGYYSEPFEPWLIFMYADKIGPMDGVGTQKHIDAESYDDYNITYRNIIFKNIESEKEFVTCITPVEGLLTIEDIHTED